jgi:hypothetical protein
MSDQQPRPDDVLTFQAWLNLEGYGPVPADHIEVTDETIDDFLWRRGAPPNVNEPRTNVCTDHVAVYDFSDYRLAYDDRKWLKGSRPGVF